MKFLHLSDLHIGKTVNGYSMLPEQRHVFQQISGYVDSEKPAAVLIAGDVYDRAVPGIEAISVFDDFLTSLALRDVAVLIISGNHDSPERLSFGARLLRDRQLHICGVWNGSLEQLTLTDELGDVSFWLLPFVKPSGVRHVFDGFDDFDEREIQSYTQAVTAILESANIDYSRRNVLVSHQFYTGAGSEPERCESEISPVGGLDAVDAGVLSQFDYVALGHLHKAQGLGGNIRYAGSPVKYSFSEWRHDKTVTMVTLGEKHDVKTELLPLTPLHDMREMRGSLEEVLGNTSADGSNEDYLRVVLTDEQELVDPMGKLRSVYPNVMSLDFENSRTSIELSDLQPDAEKIESLSLYDLFSEFFLESSGAVMSNEQSAIVRELLEGGID